MKALVLEAYNTFVYKEMPIPQIGAGEVLVEVKACGICGSDIHGMDGSTGRRKPPIIMGHEASGVICEIGDGIRGWKAGDRVTFDSTVYCGACRFCRKGLINLCDNRMVLGVSCDEYRRHGAFAQYAAIPQHILYHIPHGVTFEQAAMTEALSIAVHAVARTPLSLNDTAVVVGAGMIGLLVIQSARADGCGTIVAVDVEEAKLSKALRMGADMGMKPCDDLIKKIKGMTDGRGADIAFEVVGIASTVKTAIDCLRKGGSLTLVGNLSPAVELPLQAVVTRQLSLHGSCASCGEYPACLELIARKRVDVDALISAVVPLSEGAAWCERLYKKEPGLMKVILKPNI